MPIQVQLDCHAAKQPEKIAFQIGNQTRTYRQIAEGARAFTRYVCALDGQRQGLACLPNVGKVVALDLGNHLYFPELFVGATSNPVACAVLDPKMLPAQTRDILENLHPDLLVTAAMDSPCARIAQELGIHVLDIADIINGHYNQDIPLSDNIPLCKDDTFFINFTSGTTSKPKAFSRSRHSWIVSLERGLELFGLEGGLETVCPGALAHGLALYALVETLYSGGTFHTLAQWNAARFVDILQNHPIKRLVAVPTMIMGLAKVSPDTLPLFPEITEVLTGGAKLNRKHVELMLELFPAARLREYYGASELGFISVSTIKAANAAKTLDSACEMAQIEKTLTTVGYAFPGVRLSIRNAQNEILGPDEAGTIYVESDLISDGYLWGDDGKSFRGDINGATVGDIGELDAHGALKVLGREGGMVITGGFNAYPSEIEGVLKAIDGIEEALVFGLDDNYLGKRLVAVISGNANDRQAIIDDLAKALPRYKIPRDIYKATDFPLTTSGKIARGKVEALLEEGAYDHV